MKRTDNIPFLMKDVYCNWKFGYILVTDETETPVNHLRFMFDAMLKQTTKSDDVIRLCLSYCVFHVIIDGLVSIAWTCVVISLCVGCRRDERFQSCRLMRNTNQNSLSSSCLQFLFGEHTRNSFSFLLFFFCFRLSFSFRIRCFCVHFICTWLRNNAQAIHPKIEYSACTQGDWNAADRQLLEKKEIYIDASKRASIHLAHPMNDDSYHSITLFTLFHYYIRIRRNHFHTKSSQSSSIAYFHRLSQLYNAMCLLIELVLLFFPWNLFCSHLKNRIMFQAIQFICHAPNT